MDWGTSLVAEGTWMVFSGVMGGRAGWGMAALVLPVKHSKILAGGAPAEYIVIKGYSTNI